MQAIVTKYLPCTNSRGARIKAWCERGSITVSFDHAAHDPHLVAVQALREKFAKEDTAAGRGDRSQWAAPLIEGGLPSGCGDASRVFVFAQYASGHSVETV
jgi:hypothetical protein